QATEPRRNVFMVGQQRTFGYLGSDPARVDSSRRDLVEQPALIARPNQIGRQDIDRQAQSFERPFPNGSAAQRLALNEPRQAFGEPSGGGAGKQDLGPGNDRGAGQRLGANDTSGAGLDQRLEQDVDLLVSDDRF